MNYKHAGLLYQNMTPLHVGCGQDVGVVDLPVIRERTTGYPFIPGSGIRGSLRDYFRTNRNDLTNKFFGPESGDTDNEYAGCISIHDAKLLFYPVRSNRYVFLWITWPSVLERYNRVGGSSR